MAICIIIINYSDILRHEGGTAHSFKSH